MKFDYTGLGILITAVGVAIVNIVVAWRTSSKVNTVADKIDLTTAKVEVVAGHVNSAATASVTKIAALENQLTEMRALLANKDQIAAVLASGVKK